MAAPAGQPHYPDKPTSIKALAVEAGRESFTEAGRRTGTRTTRDNPQALMTGEFLALRVRPVNNAIPRGADGTLPAQWLLAQ